MGANFCHAPWLGGLMLKDIAPSIYNLLAHKNFTAHKSITNKHLDCQNQHLQWVVLAKHL
jgi:hypothetical protein